MKEKIKYLIEQRIIEATRKQIASKVICIAKNLGKEVIAQSVFTNYLPDVWALPGEEMVYDPSEIHTADEDWGEQNLGWYFDGLKYGVNLCIKVMAYEKTVVEIKVTYNGYVVYAEIEKSIKAYAPFPEWEDKMGMFYEGAIELEKKRVEKEKIEQALDRKKRFSNFWKSFKMLWGY